MYREDRAHVVVERQALVILAQEDRGQSRLPVIAVQDVATEIRQVLEALRDGLGEEGEALAVVEVAIEAVALKEMLIVDEVVVDAILLDALQTAVLASPPHVEIEVADMLHLVDVLLLDGAVFRKHHHDAAAGCHKRLRQRAGHVA